MQQRPSPAHGRLDRHATGRQAAALLGDAFFPTATARHMMTSGNPVGGHRPDYSLLGLNRIRRG